MKDQFVTYEIAKKLKELGFDKPCFTYFFADTNELYESTVRMYNFNRGQEVSCPLWQQVIDWFDTKKIIITRSFGSNFEGGKWLIGHKGEDNFLMFKASDTKEQAILKAIELITK
jgi:hypothetical protein